MSATDMFWAAPPVARTMTAAAVCLSVPTWLGFIDPYYVVWITSRVFTLRAAPQFWRIVSTFILTGPKLGMILDPYFLYTYGSQLEREASRFQHSGDFFVYIIFVCVIILLLGGVYLGGPMLLSPLTLALAYTYAQENPHRQLSYFIITFSAKWLPYAMLAMTFVMASPQEALLQASGLVAAHAYDFVTKIWPEYGGGRRWLTTPQFINQWLAPQAGSTAQRSFGTAYTGRPAAQAGSLRQASSSGGWASGFSAGGGNWGSRGQGRRLGGD
ncbi:F-LANa protein [Teratosphaeria destructans]|uniref:Derlin n=1 Tax=Teratosphaeria destructans TaxID=418781 RepID=A0A9W7SLH9_9PEZI|nr:F-LANa protein [Teratosphaeria destructans]